MAEMEKDQTVQEPIPEQETKTPASGEENVQREDTGEQMPSVSSADAGEQEPSVTSADTGEREPSASSEDAKEREASPDLGEDEAQEAAGTAAGEEKAEGGIKGFFKKKDKKDRKDQQIEELTDRVRRQMAEFDNFRKRTEKEKSAMFEVGAKDVIGKLLPVVDNFERGLAAASDMEDPFADGMQKIYRQLMTILEGLDVHVIEAVGKEFDPDLHNAVMHVEDESAGDNVIVEELQKGYTYRGSVVRYSMVKVAN